MEKGQWGGRGGEGGKEKCVSKRGAKGKQSKSEERQE